MVSPASQCGGGPTRHFIDRKRKTGYNFLGKERLFAEVFMSQKRPGAHKQGAPYVFIALASLLLVGVIVFGLMAFHTRETYQAEKSVTPAPSPTVHGIGVTSARQTAAAVSAETEPPAATPAPAVAAAATAASLPETDAPQEAAAPVTPTATPGTMRSGDKGQTVRDLQTRLQELGYYDGKIDGDFGSGTKNAVKAFQRQHGLTSDGVAGPKTLTVLYSDEAKPFVQPTPVNTLAGAQPLLVNKDHPVSEDFEPADLVTVKDVTGKLMTYQRDSIQGVREAVEALSSMIRAAQADGVSPWKLREGYRTYKDQQAIFDRRVKQYENDGKTHSQAVARTRKEVADPGASEHHTGLAFDLNVEGKSFVDTAQYVWLKQHCFEYGFVLRYTDEKEDITGITGEEWHVRYVGIEHARAMEELGFCLEEYIDYLNGR